MEVNSKILSILKEFNIPQKDGMPYLISVYFGYNPDYIPDNLKQKIHTTKIFEIDANESIQWNEALFEGQETKFDWVRTEYVPLFKAANPKKGGYVKDAIKRMKKIFSENPEIRKDDVIGATKMYILNTNSDYIRYPHYFIQKGVGADKTSDLMDWIEKYEISQVSHSESITTNMQ